MKKFVSIIMAVIFALTVSGCSASACASCGQCDDNVYSYMTLTKIIEIEDKTDYNNPDFDYDILITSLATDGNVWKWYSDDTSWQVGDSVILHMVDVNGTSYDKTDDEVCCVSFVQYAS